MKIKKTNTAGVFEDKNGRPEGGGRLSGVFRLILPDKALDVRGLAAAFGAKESDNVGGKAQSYIGF